MTTKHTPGPWFCENGDNRWTVWDDEGMACICDVHAGVEPDPSGATHARLIAAAPDLLAACTHALNALERVAHTVDREELDAVVEVAALTRAAIAKARGESK